MKKFYTVLFACGLAFALPQMAKAQYTFNFSLGATQIDGNFTLASQIGSSPADYTFSSFNATVTGSAFGGPSSFKLDGSGNSSTEDQEVLDASGGYDADNQFYPNNNSPNGGYFDYWGLLLVQVGGNIANRSDLLNIYCTSSSVCNIYDYLGDNASGAFTFSATPPPVVHTPESESFPMLLLCALGLAAAFFYRGRRSGLFLNS